MIFFDATLQIYFFIQLRCCYLSMYSSINRRDMNKFNCVMYLSQSHVYYEFIMEVRSSTVRERWNHVIVFFVKSIWCRFLSSYFSHLFYFYLYVYCVKGSVHQKSDRSHTDLIFLCILYIYPDRYWLSIKTEVGCAWPMCTMEGKWYRKKIEENFH